MVVRKYGVMIFRFNVSPCKLYEKHGHSLYLNSKNELLRAILEGITK